MTSGDDEAVSFLEILCILISKSSHVLLYNARERTCVFEKDVKHINKAKVPKQKYIFIESMGDGILFLNILICRSHIFLFENSPLGLFCYLRRVFKLQLCLLYDCKSLFVTAEAAFMKSTTLNMSCLDPEAE
jgi:hypothetical protein